MPSEDTCLERYGTKYTGIRLMDGMAVRQATDVDPESLPK
jgi:hypothetical protein